MITVETEHIFGIDTLEAPVNQRTLTVVFVKLVPAGVLRCDGEWTSH